MAMSSPGSSGATDSSSTRATSLGDVPAEIAACLLVDAFVHRVGACLDEPVRVQHDRGAGFVADGADRWGVDEQPDGRTGGAEPGDRTVRRQHQCRNMTERLPSEFGSCGINHDDDCCRKELTLDEPRRSCDQCADADEVEKRQHCGAKRTAGSACAQMSANNAHCSCKAASSSMSVGQPSPSTPITPLASVSGNAAVAMRPARSLSPAISG